MASKKAEGNDTPSGTATAVADKSKGAPRPPAAVSTIDFSAAADESELESTVTQRPSKWANLLDDLYTATAEGKVPRDDNGKLRFLRLGNFNNPGGARTQVKAFEEKGFDKTYEFKTQVKDKQSFLWVRVIETA